MSANLERAIPGLKPLADFLNQEFLLIGRSDQHTVTGCEIGLGNALAAARGLAIAGYRITIRSSDPYIDDPVVVEVWAEDVSA